MKHRVKGRKLSRTKNQRTALMKMLAGSLIMKGKITTTEAKAKELKPAIERIISIAKRSAAGEKNKSATYRKLDGHLPKAALQKVINGLAAKYEGKTGGYVRIIKRARRKSDSAKIAVIEFV